MVSDYYIQLYRQPRLFCETSAEVTNYVIAFCETMWKTVFTEIFMMVLFVLITLYNRQFVSLTRIIKLCDRPDMSEVSNPILPKCLVKMTNQKSN